MINHWTFIYSPIQDGICLWRNNQHLIAFNHKVLFVSKINFDVEISLRRNHFFISLVNKVFWRGTDAIKFLIMILPYKFTFHLSTTTTTHEGHIPKVACAPASTLGECFHTQFQSNSNPSLILSFICNPYTLMKFATIAFQTPTL